MRFEDWHEQAYLDQIAKIRDVALTPVVTSGFVNSGFRTRDVSKQRAAMLRALVDPLIAEVSSDAELGFVVRRLLLGYLTAPDALGPAVTSDYSELFGVLMMVLLDLHQRFTKQRGRRPKKDGVR